MNEQLKLVSEIIQEHDIRCWVDDGTLLGLMRDGELIESDRDIDFSIWEKDEDQLTPLIEHMEKEGYVIRNDRWKSKSLRYAFYPQDSTKRTIDITVYKKENNHAWNPKRTLSLKNPYESPDPRHYIIGVPRHLMYLVKDHLHQQDTLTNRSVMSVSSFPWSWYYNITHTLWIPADFFEEITLQNEQNILIPHNWEAYLEFRFGEWRTPVDDWDSLNDDGGVRAEKPSNLVS